MVKSLELIRSILDLFCTRKMLMNSIIGRIYVLTSGDNLDHRLTTPI